MEMSFNSMSNLPKKGRWRNTSYERLGIVRLGEAGGRPVFWYIIHGISGTADGLRLLSESSLLSLTADEFRDFMNAQLTRPIISFTDEEWDAVYYMPLPAPNGYYAPSPAKINGLATIYGPMSESHCRSLSGSYETYYAIFPAKPYPSIGVYGSSSWNGKTLYPGDKTWWLCDNGDSYSVSQYVDEYGQIRWAQKGERHGVRLITGLPASALAGSREQMQLGEPSELVVPSWSTSIPRDRTCYFIVGR